MKKILVMDDEETVRSFIVLNLKKEGYTVTEAADGDEAITKFITEGDIDIVLLDLMVPGKNGSEVCKEIRERDKKCGIIMLTARSQEMDKLTAFMDGADDYVTKPFSNSELLMRVDALYRRVSSSVQVNTNQSELTCGPFTLDVRSRTLTKNGEEIEVTQVEYQIMKYFMENANVALSREDILNAVWGRGYFGELKIVDVNIRRLRMKIEDVPSDPKYISTVWGYGYKWIKKD